MDFKYVLDNISNFKILQKFLDSIENSKSTVLYVESLFGEAIFKGDTHAIYKLNAFVEEFGLEIDKWNILREIYYAEIRLIAQQNRKYGETSSQHSFEHEKLRLLKQYGHVFT